MNTRPSTLDGYVGNAWIKKTLELGIQRAQGEDRALEHVLLSGPPGTGKTTLARIVAEMLGGRLVITSGPQLSSTDIVVSTVLSLNDKDVLFIDEIHRVPTRVEEVLYPVLEDNEVDLSFGRRNKIAARVPVKRATIIGATTRLASLTKPLRDRFPIQFVLETYGDDEMAVIIERALPTGVHATGEAVSALVGASRGVPRVGLSLLARVYDETYQHPHKIIDTNAVYKTLARLGLNTQGFSAKEQQMLMILYNATPSYPLSLASLASRLDEDEATIQETYEPYMIRRGYLEIVPRGRRLTPVGQEYVKGVDIEMPRV